MSEDWTWRLVGKATDDYRALEPSARTRLADKLDEVAENPWREPPDWTERLTGGPTTDSASETGAAPSRSTGTNGS